MTASRRRARSHEPRDSGFCTPCGKYRWPTRRDAKRNARTAHPGAHLDEYRCPHGFGWHYGHLQRAVVHGDIRRRN